jgi:hypothetical protein
MLMIAGILSDLIATNRQLLEDIRLEVLMNASVNRVPKATLQDGSA